MAKAFAREFYKSAAWRNMRRWVLRRDHYTCERCGGRATEVHHEVELTPGNIGDPSVCLNPELLHSLCHDCHTKITRRGVDCAVGFYFSADGQLERRIPPRG